MKQNVENKIIDAAREVFFQKGYSATTIRDIAAKAEVNLALLHYYFRTKENILKVVFEEAISLLFKKLSTALRSDDSLFDKIENMVDAYVSVGLQYPQLASFVMNELSIHTDLLMSFIVDHPNKPELNANLEIFHQQVDNAIKEGILKEVFWLDIFLDIQSLSLYPFVAKKLLIHSIFSTEEAYIASVRSRISHITAMIITNIKV